MRILVVDDNADVRESLLLMLEGAGYETSAAADGEQALCLQDQTPADVLITDIFMPGTDGIETISRFRSRWPFLKIVAMSGGGRVARRDYLAVAADIGADAVLRKPFDPTRLLQTLEDLARHAG